MQKQRIRCSTFLPRNDDATSFVLSAASFETRGLSYSGLTVIGQRTRALIG